MRSWVRSWNEQWFGPEPPLTLGVCRGLFFGALLVLYFPVQFGSWSEIPGVFWEPISVVRFGFPEQPSAAALSWIGNGWLVALLLSCLGLATKPSTAAAFVLGAMAIGIRQCFGKVYHTDGIVVLTLGILALSRCGDAMSVDSWISRRRGRPPAGPSGEYRWPIRTVWLVMALIFFNAGMSKLIHGGIGWVTTENLALKLAGFTIRGRNNNIPWMAGLAAQHPLLCRASAAMAVLVELSMILTPFSRWARTIIVPTMFVMQVGMAFLMVGTGFLTFFVVYVFWVPWAAVFAASVRPAVGRRAWRERAPVNLEGQGDCTVTYAPNSTCFR